MKQTIIVTKKELNDLIMYHKYKSERQQLCDGCPDKGYCCGCKTADTILKPLEIIERRLPPDIFKCEPVMNYAIGAVALENLYNKMLTLEIQCNKVQKEISDLRQAFTVDYEEDNDE